MTTAFIIIATISSWSYFFYIPTKSKIDNLQKEISYNKNQISKFHKLSSKSKILEKENIVFEKNFKNKFLTKNENKIVDGILKSAKDLNLKYSYVINEEESKSGLYNKKTYQLNLNGEFQKTLDFLKSIFTTDEFFRVKKCEISRNKNKGVETKLVLDFIKTI